MRRILFSYYYHSKVCTQEGASPVLFGAQNKVEKVFFHLLDIERKQAAIPLQRGL